MNAGMESSAASLPIVIVGGGLVGGVLALLLAQEGIAVTLLDATQPLAESALAQRDARVYALSPASIHLLKQVGVWTSLRRRADYHGMQVWHQDGSGRLEFGSLQPDAARLGSMVEPSVLAWALQQRLQDAGVQVQYGTRVQSIARLSAGWQVIAQDGQCWETGLLVGADGRGSVVRAQAGIRLQQLDYGQAGLTAALRMSRPHGGVARQVFLAGGPLALLPMADLTEGLSTDERHHWVSTVWTLPRDEATDWYRAPEAELVAALTRHSAQVLGPVQAVESRGLFPLTAQQAETEWLPGLALIGDAAHGIHPLAGQGVNLGLLDAALLADSLLRDHARGVWATQQSLSRYARARRLASGAMMHGMTAIGWAERQQLPPWVVLRDWGHQQVGRWPWLASQITKAASGLPALTKTRYAVTDF